MLKISLKEARKLFLEGEIIYLLPSNVEYKRGLEMKVYISKEKDNNFDEFVKSYKATTGNNKISYYIKLD